MIDPKLREGMNRDIISGADFDLHVVLKELGQIDKTIAELAARAESPERDLMLLALRRRRAATAEKVRYAGGDAE